MHSHHRDVGAGELGGGSCPTDEAVARLSEHQLAPQDLDSRESLEQLLAGEVDGSIPPYLADPVAGDESQGVRARRAVDGWNDRNLWSLPRQCMAPHASGR